MAGMFDHDGFGAMAFLSHFFSTRLNCPA